MKVYRRIVLFVQGLRTGFLFVCFLVVMYALTGCGSEDIVLSQLRGEAVSEEDTALRNEESSETESDHLGVAQSAKQDVAAKEIPGADQSEGTVNMEDQAETGMIYVHVCGAVKRPGVYKLPSGSRFYEAVEAAGGFTEEACQDYLNMAAPLADGSRLEIPTLEEAGDREEAEKAESGSNGNSRGTDSVYYTLPVVEAGEGSESAENASDKLVNINTADIAGLCSLPGIGEGRAKAIIEYREKQGGFQKKEDIMQVSGIGEKMYARMEDCLTVE